MRKIEFVRHEKPLEHKVQDVTGCIYWITIISIEQWKAINTETKDFFISVVSALKWLLCLMAYFMRRGRTAIIMRLMDYV